MNKPLLFLGLFLFLVILLGFNAEWLNNYLSYDRGALQAGQVWRVISAHLVHTNVYHTLMNVSILTVAAFLFARSVPPGHWVWVFLLLCLMNSLGLYLLSPQVLNYVGMSGVLYGILSFGLLAGIKHNKLIYGVTLFLLGAKIIWEQLPGYDIHYLRSKIDAAVIVDAHLYGYLGGALISLAYYLFRARFNTDLRSSE